MKKEIIGRNEIVDLPEMELFQLRAKVDTGAYTSAIHYHHAEVIKKDGEDVLHFTLLDPSHEEYNDKSFYFKQFKTKKIKNSFGQSEERYIIQATIRIFDKDIQTEFSLSDRGNLKFPLLLGRKLLNKHFIVDTSKKNLSLKSNKK
ncbi:ATP-dependent zinc protease family protein [Fulvivirga lutea]|uniref:ATP-dependent zinc protease n=1 Tax=Fulvivirga lutea TaxID=2810512 RepID=A0A974WMQ1_9BACT|nr:RimK/LysX family protein [Fulvivirga lutea]QSE99110.1 ATP-dependent zinc protease [Fulvivirga lutea]